MDTLNILLKDHSDTRWVSKAQDFKALKSQIKDVFKILKNIFGLGLGNKINR